MPQSPPIQFIINRIAPALAAGTIAILLNVGALASADLIPLATAHGGLLRLLSMITGIAPPGGTAFETEFHIVVGLVMTMFYAIVLEPILPGRAWLKGMQYAVVLWLANALIVLPLTNEGFAGSRHLTFPGMLWFAAAHTLFFVFLAVLFARFRSFGSA